MARGVKRRFDLRVVMQSDHDSWMNNDLLIEMALFEAGRPLMVVPYTQRERLNLEKILCCWDGSRTAARAINDALPFLRRAKAVELLTVTTEKNPDGCEIPGIDIGAHLARHDIKVEVAATAVIVASVIPLALLVPFAWLAEGTSLATLVVFALVNTALLKLRYRRAVSPHPHVSVRIWVPALGLVACIAMILSSLL